MLIKNGPRLQRRGPLFKIGCSDAIRISEAIGARGFEPPTSCSQSRHSAKLSYAPRGFRAVLPSSRTREKKRGTGPDHKNGDFRRPPLQRHERYFCVLTYLEGRLMTQQLGRLDEDGLILPITEKPALNSVLLPALNRNDFVNTRVLVQLFRHGVSPSCTRTDDPIPAHPSGKRSWCREKRVSRETVPRSLWHVILWVSPSE